MSLFKTITGALLVAVMTACGGGGGDASTPVTVTPVVPPVETTPSATSKVASISIASPTGKMSLNANSGSSLTLQIRALDAFNGLVKGATITLSTSKDSSLSDSSVTTDAITGLATFTLYADQANQNTRIATVTASCSQCVAAPVSVSPQINGATINLTPTSGSSNLLVGDKPSVNAVVKGVGTNPSLPIDTTVTFSSSDTRYLSVLPSGTIGISGVASAVVTAVAQTPINTTVYITATALGNSASYAFSVGPAPVTPLGIAAFSVNNSTSLANNAVLLTTDQALISVTAPGASSISYSSSLGGPAAFTVLQQPNAGNSYTGTANFSNTLGGKALITVADDKSRTNSITLYVSPPVANKIVITASPTTLGLATNSNTPTTQLKAQALFAGNGSTQGVANIPVFFSLVGGPNSGEYLSPSYALTDTSGYAYANFYSGTSATSSPIVVSAQIGTPPSTTYVAKTNLTIGGTALSVAFGRGSSISESSDQTLYIQNYSVQVADVAGNPVENAVVTLSVRPIAFSLGSGCAVKKDQYTVGADATYCSEDANGNGLLDSNSPSPGEDGVRKLTTVATAGQCASLVAGPAGNPDGLLTPANSVAGTVPITVTTGTASAGNAGTAAFSLTYLKASAIWVVDMLTATVSSGGTESTTSTIFQLPASEADVKLPDTCHIPPSPFAY